MTPDIIDQANGRGQTNETVSLFAFLTPLAAGCVLQSEIETYR